MVKANLSGVKLVHADLSRANLVEANLSSADLRDATLHKADVSRADLFHAILGGAFLAEVVGAHQAYGLETVEFNPDPNTFIPRDDARYFEACHRPWPEHWVDWERLKVAGRLPLFGVSYTVLILIPMIFYGLALYNDKIDLVRAWAEQAVTSPDHPLHRLAPLILERLHPRLIPSQSFVLLASTVLLAIASTLYTLRCPSRIKEFSRDQWCDQLGRSLMHYWPFAWKHRYIRLVCAACYALGGVGAALGARHEGVADRAVHLGSTRLSRGRGGDVRGPWRRGSPLRVGGPSAAIDCLWASPKNRRNFVRRRYVLCESSLAGTLNKRRLQENPGKCLWRCLEVGKSLSSNRLNTQRLINSLPEKLNEISGVIGRAHAVSPYKISRFLRGSPCANVLQNRGKGTGVEMHNRYPPCRACGARHR